MTEIGYDWKPAEKRKPRANEIIKFKRVEPDAKEFLAIWNGERYYVFDIYSGRWKTLESIVFAYPADNQKVALLGYLYAYIPRESTRYIPYWALANSRKSDIIGRR